MERPSTIDQEISEKTSSSTENSQDIQIPEQSEILRRAHTQGLGEHVTYYDSITGEKIKVKKLGEYFLERPDITKPFLWRTLYKEAPEETTHLQFSEYTCIAPQNSPLEYRYKIIFLKKIS